MAAATTQTRFQAFTDSISQKISSLKSGAGDRLKSVGEKISLIPQKGQQGATFLWNQLTPSTQRHLQLVWSRDAGQFVGVRYEKNVLEEIGDWMLYPSMDLPKKLLNCKGSPIVVGLASIGAVFFLFKLVLHPLSTLLGIAHRITALPGPLLFLAKINLAGLACRSLGRWTNAELMHQFHRVQTNHLDMP